MKLKKLVKILRGVSAKHRCRVGLHDWKVANVLLTGDGMSDAGDLYVKAPAIVILACSLCGCVWNAGCANVNSIVDDQTRAAAERLVARGMQIRACFKKQPPCQ